MELRSPAFERGDPLPIQYTRDGENVSPPLEWSDVPPDAEELVIVLENLTPATDEPDIQWVAFGISPNAEGLPGGLGHEREPGRGGGV